MLIVGLSVDGMQLVRDHAHHSQGITAQGTLLVLVVTLH